MTTATVLLAKGLDQDGLIVEVRGTPFHKTGRTGVADGIEAVQELGLIQVSSYLLGEGRVAAGRDAEARGNIKLALEEPVWNQWHDAFAETNTIVDKKGILGAKGQLYVASFQNGGFFVHDSQRIEDSVQGKSCRSLTSHYTMPLDQKTEVDLFLDAVKRKDTAVLVQKGWMKEGSLYLFNDFNQFDEESSRRGFLSNMPSYAVLRTAESARGNYSGYQSLEIQRNNEDLAIAFGGKGKLGAMLDVAGKLGWEQFGSHHDGYKHENSGRVVVVYYRYGGVYSYNLVKYGGRPVGVAPEALAARAKIVSPIETAVTQEATNGGQGPYRKGVVGVTDYHTMIKILDENKDALSPKNVSGLAGIVYAHLSTRGQ